MRDVAIIGAGPVGSELAILCSGDMDVLVLEEDETAGNKACSGLVSERFMGMVPKGIRKSVVSHEVKAAIVHFMGREFEFRKSSPAYVIDRNTLDVMMAREAEKAGAEIVYASRVSGIKAGRKSVSVAAGKKMYEASVVAGCDGARSVVARHIGVRPKEIINGLIIYEERKSTEDFVEMWFEGSIARDGFFWKIPRGDSVEYGCMGKGLGFKVLERFFGMRDVPKESMTASPIPIGAAGRTYSDRMIIVGDAAGQTKPWSGGGLAYGFMAAQCASKVLMDSKKSGDFSKRSLSLYEKSWKSILSRDMDAGMILHEMLKDMGTSDIPEITGLAQSVMGKSKSVDFDFPFSSTIAKKLHYH